MECYDAYVTRCGGGEMWIVRHAWLSIGSRAVMMRKEWPTGVLFSAA